MRRSPKQSKLCDIKQTQIHRRNPALLSHVGEIFFQQISPCLWKSIHDRKLYGIFNTVILSRDNDFEEGTDKKVQALVPTCLLI